MARVKTCKRCGQEFLAAGHYNRVYCDTCREELRKGRQAEYQQRERKTSRAEYKYCTYCGKRYRPVRYGQKFCSPKCAKARVEDDWLRVWADRNEELTKAAVEAKKAGESYGQYKARLWMEEQKRKEDEIDEG